MNMFDYTSKERPTCSVYSSRLRSEGRCSESRPPPNTAYAASLKYALIQTACNSDGQRTSVRCCGVHGNETLPPRFSNDSIGGLLTPIAAKSDMKILHHSVRERLPDAISWAKDPV